MDGNHSSGYPNNYGHSWNHAHGQEHSEGVDGEAPLDSLSDIDLTGSQTQAIASIMDANLNLFQVSDPNAQLAGDIIMDHSMFAEGTHDFEGYQHAHQQHFGDPLTQQQQHHYHQNLGDQVPPPTPTVSSSLVHGVPAMDNWAGPLDYGVEFSNAQDKTKATPWVYSTKLDKLFVSLDKACPIKFKVKNEHPGSFPQYQIRGQVVYSRPEDFQDAVERCINHQNKDVAAVQHAAHVLRCDETSSKYFDHENKRHSVVVPLKTPAPGTQSVTFCFRFMCLSSCIGSLNRRPTTLIFTLEHIDGTEIGRYACSVRICSCPGRDVRSEEEKATNESDVQNSNKVLTESSVTGDTGGGLIPIPFPPPGFMKGKSKKRKATTTATTPSVGSLEPARPINGQGEVFNLNVNIRGRAEFDAIRQMVENMLRVFEEQNARLANNGNTTYPPAEPTKRFKEEP